MLGAYYLGTLWSEPTVKAGPSTPSTVRVEINLPLLTPENVQNHFNPEGILNFTNKYRTEKGLDPLTMDESLVKSACMKAEDMVAKNYWSHDAPDGTKPWYFFREVGYNYQRAGENLAYGQKHSMSVVDGWIKSPEHEKNLVGDYTEMGVCTVYASSFHYRAVATNITVAHYATR